jgi:flagellar basal body-associated protein FliL
MTTETKIEPEVDLIAEQDATDLDEKISGEELDDEFSGSELDDEFSGDELDDDTPDTTDSDETGVADETGAAEETEDGGGNSAPAGKKAVLKKMVLPALAAGLIFLGLGGWFFFKSYLAWQTEKPRVARFKIEYPKAAALSPFKKEEVSFERIKPVIVTFKPFIVPVKPDGNITYISMDIALSLSTGDLTEEIKEKRVILRGIIYGFLEKQVKNGSKRPTTDSMESSITRAVNRYLEGGNVREVNVESWQPM